MRVVNKDDLLIGTTRRGGSQGGCQCVSVAPLSSPFISSLQQNKALLASVLFQHMIDASVMKSEAYQAHECWLVTCFCIMVEIFTILCTQLVFDLFYNEKLLNTFKLSLSVKTILTYVTHNTLKEVIFSGKKNQTELKLY